jgi:L-ascorbate metabolism protein UlaG (beta-lactamase superfamily)
MSGKKGRKRELFMTSVAVVIAVAAFLAYRQLVLTDVIQDVLPGPKSSDVTELENAMSASPPTDTSDSRVSTLNSFDDFIRMKFTAFSNPQEYLSSDLYALVRARMRQAIEEISNTSVPPGRIRLWYIYNMGVVAKTSDATVGFDIAGSYVYPYISNLVDSLDVLVITHPHGDHMDKYVIKKAAEKNMTVIIPGEKVSLTGSDPSYFFVKDPNGKDLKDSIGDFYKVSTNNIVMAKPGETLNIGSVAITAFAAKHGFPAQPNQTDEKYDAPLYWYYVNLSGFGLLHTGDGMVTGNVDLSGRPVDVFLAKYNDEMTLEDFYKMAPNTRYMIPLHLHELGHGLEITQYAMFRNALEQFSGGYLKLMHVQPLTKIRYVPMIWGESFEISK